jgi:hypothetical protein
MVPYPNGWCRVVTVSGADGGLGFHCEKCHYQINHSAPDAVFHCGKLQKLEKSFWVRLPKVKLGQPGLTLLD